MGPGGGIPTRHASTVLIPCLLAAVLVLSLVPRADAQMETMMGSTMSETFTLPENEYKAYGVSLSQAAELRFSMQVTMGGAVDVYMMDASGYAQYKDPMMATFSYYHGCSQENTTYFGCTFTAPQAGTYYMVLDNAPIAMGGAPGATPSTIQVSAQVASPGVDPGLVLVAIVVVAVLSVGSILIVWSTRRKRRMQAPPPPPPGAPGWGTYGTLPPTPPATAQPPVQGLPPPPKPPGT